MNKRQELSDFTADFVTGRQTEVCLKRLFEREAGKWYAVRPLCEEFETVSQRLEVLENSVKDVLQASWLDYPESGNGEGYVTVVFFVERLIWSNVAIYNKDYLFRQTAHGMTSSRLGQSSETIK